MPGDHRLRPATPADAPAMAAAFLAAARAAWTFLDPPAGDAASGRGGVLTRLPAPAEAFRTRLEAGERGFVAEGGFVLVGAGGEVLALYVDPERQRRGLGRALLEAALAEIAAQGHGEAVLWTEERNAGPLAFYARLGWRPDGAVRERTWHGVPLRELRLRRPTELRRDATHAGPRSG